MYGYFETNIDIYFDDIHDINDLHNLLLLVFPNI